MAARKPSEAAAGGRRSEHGPRHHARALALQGLYGWLLAEGAADQIGTQLLTEEQIAKIDVAYFREVLSGTIGAADELRAQFADLVDRPVNTLSPVEHALLLMGAYEFRFHPEIPYRVTINEAIELAKSFGGTDGYRYVNGVLDKLATRMRPQEAAARPSASEG
jgi:N utilization substance protein B